MTGVVIAIVSFMVLYTGVNVAFRKPERPHEPAAEARERRRKFVQASMNGWTRLAALLTAENVAPAAAAAPAPSAPVGRGPAPADLAKALPLELVGIFPEAPSLHAGPASLLAPAAIASGESWQVELRFAPAPSRDALGEVLAYAKDNHLFLFLQDKDRPVFEEAPTPAAPIMHISLPAIGSAGDWRATLYARDAMFTWTFVVP